MKRLFQIVLVASIFATACASITPSATPTPETAPTETMVPLILPTSLPATIVPTATVTPAPTPMACTPDDVLTGEFYYSDYRTISDEVDGKEVTWLMSGQTYTVLLTEGGQQLCLGVGSNNGLHLIEHFVSDRGLSETYNYTEPFQEIVGFTGRATVEWTEDWVLESITIENGPVTGPNDALVRSVWPSQKRRINEAGQELFKDPILEGSVGEDFQSTPEYLCWVMGVWERIAPLPKEIAFCQRNYYYPQDIYLGQYYYLIPNGPLLEVFWIKPETEYAQHGESEPVKFEDAGYLVAGQELSPSVSVLATCTEPEAYDFGGSEFRDPVSLDMTVANGHLKITVPRNAYVGIGYQSGQGWEKLYRVCHP